MSFQVYLFKVWPSFGVLEQTIGVDYNGLPNAELMPHTNTVSGSLPENPSSSFSLVPADGASSNTIRLGIPVLIPAADLSTIDGLSKAFQPAALFRMPAVTQTVFTDHPRDPSIRRVPTRSRDQLRLPTRQVRIGGELSAHEVFHSRQFGSIVSIQNRQNPPDSKSLLGFSTEHPNDVADAHKISSPSQLCIDHRRFFVIIPSSDASRHLRDFVSFSSFNLFRPHPSPSAVCSENSSNERHLTEGTPDYSSHSVVRLANERFHLPQPAPSFGSDGLDSDAVFDPARTSEAQRSPSPKNTNASRNCHRSAFPV